MPELLKYALYFFLGGLLVSVATYMGTLGKGFFAAWASTFPAITGMTFILIYLNAGNAPTLSFAKHLLWMTPPWLVYVSFIIFAIPRLGFWPAFAGGLSLYMTLVWLLRLALR